ncbi:glucokinase [Ensifer sesbaniae]|uniref:glucokinase n=1 Tax=Ensifer sesbaniae TaxID=1214071 RepID=UPI002000FAE8|nr:glucokinase [Ensifer sesbaniae]MCK3781053.1 glucokinase [Ensifer sesbaniae]NRQ12881.1 Glucokinase [Ensifer sesbaniae]
MNKFTHEAVVADIGETHMRFAVVHTDRLTIEDYVQFGKNVFGSVVEALAAYRRSLPICPPALGITIANSELLPVSDLERRLAEGHAGEWHHVQIIDSIDALSLVLPDLAPHDVVQFGGAEGRRDAAKAVASIGDAVGVGVLTQINGSCSQFHTRAGSMSFAPRTHEELDILERVRSDAGHVSVEHLLSGRGLAQLYQILLESSGQPARFLQAADIVSAGLQGDDRCATTAINYFATWLGRFAGDIALLYEARGGVYLWGPILRKMEKLLHNGAFRLAFEAKGRRSDWLSQIPVFLIRSEDAVLRGAAKALTQDMR